MTRHLTYRPQTAQIPADPLRGNPCDSHDPQRCVPPLKGLPGTRTASVSYRALSPYGDSLQFRISATHPVHPQPIMHYESCIMHCYTFSAKERDPETGLSYFGSRYYNSDLSIWLSVDPMSDKYPSLSPYTYCANNPVRLVDPNGDTIVIAGVDGRKIIYMPGMVKTGDRFTQETIDALNELYSGKSSLAKEMVEKLSSSNYNYRIEYSDVKSDFFESDYFSAAVNVQDEFEATRKSMLQKGEITNGCGGIIRWKYLECLTKVVNGVDNLPIMGLAHELAHAYDAMRGLFDRTEVNELAMCEWQACDVVNIIRASYGFSLQTHYGGRFSAWRDEYGNIKYNYIDNGYSLDKSPIQ